jgi:dUTPase
MVPTLYQNQWLKIASGLCASEFPKSSMPQTSGMTILWSVRSIDMRPRLSMVMMNYDASAFGISQPTRPHFPSK